MQLHTIDTGYFKLDGGAMFGVVPKTIWNNINPSDEKNLTVWAMRCLLVELNDRLILIDCGMGKKQSEKFFSYYEPFGDETLESSLKKKGFSPDDITDMFLTHLHFDHCGGAIKFDSEKKLVPAFKNAIYWSNEKHWETATKPNQREKASFLKENILPIKESGQLKFADDGDEIYPGFKVMVVNGHTEAMVLPIIQYKNQTVAYMADLIPSVGHISIPYVMAYDIRPMITLQEKEIFLNEAASNNYILFFEHDRSIEACTIVNVGGRIKKGEEIQLRNL